MLDLPLFKKSQEDEIFLTQVLLDLAHFKACKNDFHEIYEEETQSFDKSIIPNATALVFTDAFSAGYYQGIACLTWKGVHDTFAWFAFAAQLQLDIRDIMGDQVKQAHTELKNKIPILEQKLDLKSTVVDKTKKYMFGSDWPLDPSSTKPKVWKLLHLIFGSGTYLSEKYKEVLVERTDFRNIRAAVYPPWDHGMNIASRYSKVLEITRLRTIKNFVQSQWANAVSGTIGRPLFLAAFNAFGAWHPSIGARSRNVKSRPFLRQL